MPAFFLNVYFVTILSSGARRWTAASEDQGPEEKDQPKVQENVFRLRMREKKSKPTSRRLPPTHPHIYLVGEKLLHLLLL